VLPKNDARYYGTKDVEKHDLDHEKEVKCWYSVDTISDLRFEINSLDVTNDNGIKCSY